jgi:hypothetical protein
VTTPGEVAGARALLQQTRGGPRLLRVRIAPGETARALPARDGVYLKTRFRQNLDYKVS